MKMQQILKYWDTHTNYCGCPSPLYNGQISVDADNQIIVGQHVNQQANDTQEVQPALESIEAAAGQLPDKMSLDNGYMTGSNLEARNESPIDAYIATNKGEKTHKDELEKQRDRSINKLVFFRVILKFRSIGLIAICQLVLGQPPRH